MVTVVGGDLVRTDGTDMHIKSADGNTIVYWAADVEEEYCETLDEFMGRARQSGQLIIKPGEGRYDDEIPSGGRDEVDVMAQRQSR